MSAFASCRTSMKTSRSASAHIVSSASTVRLSAAINSGLLHIGPPLPIIGHRVMKLYQLIRPFVDLNQGSLSLRAKLRDQLPRFHFLLSTCLGPHICSP